MKHIFTLFLNQKRRYGGMLAEQMLVFFVLLFCFVIYPSFSCQPYPLTHIRAKLEINIKCAKGIATFILTCCMLKFPKPGN